MKTPDETTKDLYDTDNQELSKKEDVRSEAGESADPISVDDAGSESIGTPKMPEEREEPEADPSQTPILLGQDGFEPSEEPDSQAESKEETGPEGAGAKPEQDNAPEGEASGKAEALEIGDIPEEPSVRNSSENPEVDKEGASDSGTVIKEDEPESPEESNAFEGASPIQENGESEDDDEDFDDELDFDLDDEEYDDWEPKKKGHLLRNILIAIVGVAVLIGAYYAYNRLQESRYASKVAEGNQQLAAMDYGAAINSFQAAIDISSNKEEAYTGLGDACIFAGDAQRAKETFTKLYQLTGDYKDEERASLALFGNSNGNITSGGSVTQQATTTYIINNYQNTSTIYRKRKDADMEALLNMDMNPSMPPKSINAWGSGVYFIKDNDIWFFDQNTSVLSRFNKANVNQILIYDGLIYYSTYVDGTGGLIYSCGLDGSADTLFFKTPNRIENFIIENGSIYATVTNNSHTSTELRRITMSDKGTQKVYENPEALITEMATKSGTIYYRLVSASNPALNNSVYSLNIADNSSKELFKQTMKVDAINTGNNTLYYITNRTLYRAALNGNQQTRIGDMVDLVAASNNPAYVQANEVNTTYNDVYVISSLVTSNYSDDGFSDSIRFAPYGNLNSYTQLPIGPAPAPINKTPDSDSVVEEDYSSDYYYEEPSYNDTTYYEDSSDSYTDTYTDTDTETYNDTTYDNDDSGDTYYEEEE